jgi:hypothetical protein
MEPRFKCGRPLPIYSTLTMGAGHYSRPPDERLLPRAKVSALQALSMAELKRGQVQPSHKKMKAKRSGRSRLILALKLPADCKLWCVFLGVLSYTHSSSTMPRERGKPRRGSAWHTHAAHRQRRQHMERALSLENSILRQRARVARFALHAPIIESATEKRAQTPPALDNWQPTDIKREENPPPAPETQAGSSLRGKIEEDFPTCYIEEIPCPENTSTALEPQARDKTRGRLCEDIPTCYVEEVPYMDEVSQRICAVKVHHTDIAAMDKDEASAEAKKGTSGEADTKGMHAPLLRAAHLDLVFELRGQMADQEHRALLMGQRLDMLLDAYSNAPANRKCPTCAQPFVIQAKAAWQEDEDDRSPGI